MWGYVHLVRLVLVLGSLLLLETAEGVRLCWGRGRPMIRITSCHRWRQGQMRVLLGLLLALHRIPELLRRRLLVHLAVQKWEEI